jgi:hypothetical protein
MHGFNRGSFVVVAAVGLAAMAIFLITTSMPTAAEPPAAEKSEKKDAKTPAAPPASVKTPVEPADNSYCLVCHLNYETEKLTREHQMAGIGCANCHGESAKHSGDEDGITPPDIMYAEDQVDNYCMTCHPKDKLLEKDKKNKTDYHQDLLDLKAEDHLICTECHGENHRMEVRTRRWDKKTRKLISDDGVRMMYKDSPATEGVRPNKDADSDAKTPSK